MARFERFLRKKKEEKKEGEQLKQEVLPDTDENIQKMFEDTIWLKRLLSHNFRMPMAIISGYGDMLKDGNFKSRSEEEECIRKICRNISYLDTLTKVILDDDREDTLQTKEIFDLLPCVREVSEYVKTIARKEGIEIRVNSSRDRIFFYGNRITVMRALFNLVENSVRYMKRAGEIFITIEEMEKAVVLIYRDDGEGMDEKEAEKIGTIGYQGTNHGISGHGIGMYLVRQMVEEHGGQITIRSGIGKGMSVYMEFPKNL